LTLFGKKNITSLATVKMKLIMLSLLLVALTTAERHGFSRGYKTSRSWSTGPKRDFRRMQSREGRQQGGNSVAQFPFLLPECAACAPEDEVGEVCGTDGKTYPSTCQLYQFSCKLAKRQGRALISAQLRLEVDYPGACKPVCAGMEVLGAFSSFGGRATNTGDCVQDFFRCVRQMVSTGMERGEVTGCCQTRFKTCTKQ